MGGILRWLLILIVVVAAALAALVLLAPRLERVAEPIAGAVENGALVLQGEALRSPDTSPEQRVAVTEDDALHIEVLPAQPSPTPAERGVRVLLTDENAALIEDRPVTIEIGYTPVSTVATELAVSLQGIGPAEWRTQPIGAGAGTLRYELPAQIGVSAIGLRVVNWNGGAVKVDRIRIVPQQAAPAP